MMGNYIFTLLQEAQLILLAYHVRDPVSTAIYEMETLRHSQINVLNHSQ